MILILLFLSEFWPGILNLKTAKHLKKELTETVWHPKRFWNFCMSENEKKEIEPIFID